MKPTSERSYDFLWMSIALLFLLPIALLLSIPPHDYWWYVRLGKDIMETGAVPVVDTYSYTFPGRPIFYQPWLSGVIFWWTHDLGGAAITFLLRSVCIGIALGVVWKLMREAGTETRIASLLLIIMGLSSSINWSMRPQIFAYPLFAITLWIIWQWNNGHTKQAWVLPITSLLWANLHGSFILAFILMGSAWLFGNGDRKRLTIWIGISLLATFLNPRGIYVWQFVPDMLTSPSDQLYATEWRPPVNDGWQMNIFFGWLLLFIPLAAISPRKLSALEWVWLVGFGWLALSGLRYVIWFMFILAIYTGALVTPLISKYVREPDLENAKPKINYILGVLLLVLPLMILPGIRDSWWDDAPPPYTIDTTPIEATKWMEEHPLLPGPLFADYTFGSYLTFALPARPLWIDNRFNAYPPEHWEKYQAISAAKPGWENNLDNDKINLLLLSLHTQPSLVQAVEASDQWCEEYRDNDTVIFSRCVPIQ